MRLLGPLPHEYTTTEPFAGRLRRQTDSINQIWQPARLKLMGFKFICLINLKLMN